MKKILLIATGGTIASVKTEQGLAPGITAEELLDALPQIQEVCDVEVEQIYNIDSTNVTVGHWQQLVRTIDEHYSEYDGFVITHGTDTLAYTAAALSYMIQGNARPVVLTGSQLPLQQEGTDAFRNLQDAFLCAADHGSSGVCVVFCGRVIDGLRARKMCTHSFDAFASINYPELAEIEDGRVKWHIPDERKMDRKEGRPVFYYKMDPNICVLKLTPGLNPSVFLWIMEQVPGVILEGYGAGGIPCYLKEVFYQSMQERKEKGFITMMATQAFLEGTAMDTYEVGREAKRKTGIIECEDMTIEAAAAKMMWSLGQSEKEKE